MESMAAPAMHELEDMDDTTLLLAHQSGAEHALRVLIQRYRNEVYGYLFRYMGNAALAEDAFQETFVQIHLAGHTFDPTRPFRPWLFTIATNKARDLHRRTKKHRMPSLDAPMGEDGDATVATLIPDGSEAVESQVQKAEVAQRVRSVVDALPELHREILLLGYFQRMSYQQVAEVLNIPLGTVKSRLHAAVARFSEAWMRKNGEGNDPS